MTMIRGGTGTGYFAKVDSNNRLFVDGVIDDRIAQSTKTGASFGFSTDSSSISTTELSVLYWKNTNSAQDFAINTIAISATAAIGIVGRIYTGASAPSANNTDVTPTNLNTGSANPSGLEVDKWDGSGSGMTHATAGTQTFGHYFTHTGYYPIQIDGALIVSPGSTMRLSLQRFSAGTDTIIVSVTGYLIPS